jgi:hypothetical protein
MFRGTPKRSKSDMGGVPIVAGAATLDELLRIRFSGPRLIDQQMLENADDGADFPHNAIRQSRVLNRSLEIFERERPGRDSTLSTEARRRIERRVFADAWGRHSQNRRDSLRGSGC